MRQHCARQLLSIGGFDGYGFGGRHLDDKGKRMDDILRTVAKSIPDDKLKFALGIGTPADIVACVAMGWQMFDCVIPTREGRHGRVFVWDYQGNQFAYGTVNVGNEVFKRDLRPIDQKCDCGCADYSRAYIHHLFAVGDSLAGTICARHNLRFYAQLMDKLQNR